MYEVDLLSVRYRRTQEREDRRAALPALLLANIHRDSDVRAQPFDLREIVDWLGHGFQRADAEITPTPVEAPSVDELVERTRMLHELYSNGIG